MALSGSFKTTDYNGRLYTLSWTATQSIANNTSSIKWTLSTSGGASSWYAERTLKVVVAGKTVINKTDRVERYAGTIDSGTVVINHNTDGSKSFSASVQAAVYKTSVNCSGSGSWTLNKIPRQANITAAPNFDDEDNPKITYSNPAGSAAEKLEACISLDGSTDDIAYRDISKTGSTYTFNLTDAERNVLRNATKTANSRKVRFYVATTIGGTTYRDYIEKTLTITNAAPTLNPTAKDTNSAAITLTGDADNKVIKYFNTMSVSAGAAAKKGATIKSIKISCGGKSITTASGTLTNVESGSFVFSVTDSRGNTTTKTLTKTLINYIKLTCDLAVNAPTTAGDMTFTVSGKYFNATFGALANTLLVQYRIKENSGSYGAWTTITGVTADTKTYKADVSLSGLNYLNSYTIQARVSDRIYNGTAQPIVLSAAKTVKTTPIFDWGANDFAFNVPVAFKAGYTADNKVLWSGSYYMTEGQTAKLNDAISNQASGIVLIFSRYDISNSEALNEHFNFHYVPKQLIALHAGKGCVFNMATSNETFSASKYLYIDDTSIGGHANNDAVGTGATGVSYNNNRFVLRYVIGV